MLMRGLEERWLLARRLRPLLMPFVDAFASCDLHFVKARQAWEGLAADSPI